MHTEVFYTNKNIKDFKIAIFSDLHFYPGYPAKVLNKILKHIRFIASFINFTLQKIFLKNISKIIINYVS